MRYSSHFNNLSQPLAFLFMRLPGVSMQPYPGEGRTVIYAVTKAASCARKPDGFPFFGVRAILPA